MKFLKNEPFNLKNFNDSGFKNFWKLDRAAILEEIEQNKLIELKENLSNTLHF
jgi:hypothetical protein